MGSRALNINFYPIKVITYAIIDGMELSTKQKGAIAEMAVAQDLLERGLQVYKPLGEFGDADLLLERADGLIERVQVKYAAIKDECIPVRNRCHSVLAGRVQGTRMYNQSVDWIAVFEPSKRSCYYIPAAMLKSELLSLRVEGKGNKNTHWAYEFKSI